MRGAVKIHELSRLQEDGFIRDNGTLAIRLSITKNNLQKKLSDVKEEM